jgi:Na+-driven multidrug efflux pump
MKSREQTKELETLPVSRLLFKFAVPAMTGTFVNSMYTVGDRMFLGHYVGEMGIAATTVVML